MPPTLEEVRREICSLRNNRAPGIDDICAEMLKKGGDKLLETLHQLIEQCWNQETIPDEWNSGAICPIHKKGDKMDCSNYRGITLLGVVYKVFSAVIRRRLDPIVEDLLGEYQCGFRRSRSTINQLFNIRQIMEKMWEYNIDMHHLFIDFKQAYDSVKRQPLLNAMKELGIPTKYIRLVKTALSNTKSCVRVLGDDSRTFEITNGLRQGDGLSPVLFNIALEWTIRKAQINTTGTIVNRTTQILAYADDIDLIARNKTAITSNYKMLEETAREIGLSVNTAKTKYMAMETGKRREENLQIDGKTFEKVDSFDYLGSTITSSHNMSKEIQKRIMSGNRGLFGLARIFRAKEVKRSTKAKIYQTLLRPAVLYGCETWTMSKEDQQRLLTFERKVLRRIYGPLQNSDGSWRIRYNYEIQALYNQPNIVAVAKSTRIRWAGHVARMNADNTSRRLLEAKIYTDRRRGRPKIRWIDNVIEDLEKIGTTNWKVMAQDRKEWRNVARKALTHKGLTWQ